MVAAEAAVSTPSMLSRIARRTGNPRSRTIKGTMTNPPPTPSNPPSMPAADPTPTRPAKGRDGLGSWASSGLGRIVIARAPYIAA